MSKYGLVYYTSFHDEDTNLRRWPISGDEILDRGCAINWWCSDWKDNVEWESLNPDNLVTRTRIAVDSMTARGIRNIWTVHPLSVLIPLYRWSLMRSNYDGNIKMETQALKYRCFDLCEAFHKPAILTYEARKKFGPDVVSKWLLDGRGIKDNKAIDTIITSL